jgi:hypothetical protein
VTVAQLACSATKTKLWPISRRPALKLLKKHTFATAGSLDVMWVLGSTRLEGDRRRSCIGVIVALQAAHQRGTQEDGDRSFYWRAFFGFGMIGPE